MCAFRSTAIAPLPSPRSEGTNATHHRWGIDRVPTPKEIVEHLDQYVIGQVRKGLYISAFLVLHTCCIERYCGAPGPVRDGAGEDH